MDLNPTRLARRYIEEVAAELAELPGTPCVRGFIASDDEPSIRYAESTRDRFTEVGIRYELVRLPRLDLETALLEANDDPAVHGVFIYFPVFDNEEDMYLRNLVDPTRDIEAGSSYWTRKLRANERRIDISRGSGKALLPCTPLAIVKMLAATGIYDEDAPHPVASRTAVVFNRSEVTGRPLAVMMSNDGADVFSFDEHGALLFRDGRPRETTITRSEALSAADMVITGVPDARFPAVRPDEIKPGAICLNFSSIPNFADGIETAAGAYIPRIGPMTVAMCMRNTLRLYRNYHL